MQALYQSIRSINLLKTIKARRQANESSFYEKNRKLVLSHYRYLLKTVPALYQRRLQQRSIYIEICHLFHQSKVLSSLEQTKNRHEHLDRIVGEIKLGDYGNIGTYLPARQGEILYLQSYLKKVENRFDK